MADYTITIPHPDISVQLDDQPAKSIALLQTKAVIEITSNLPEVGPGAGGGGFATAAQGAKADSALQPGDIGASVAAQSSITYLISEIARLDARIDDGGGTPPNAAPVAAFTSAISGLAVTFTDTSTDSDGTIASWAWDFGDGATSTSQSPTHTYGAAGSYTVTLTVTDNDGRPSAPVSHGVTVADAAPSTPAELVSSGGAGWSYNEFGGDPPSTLSPAAFDAVAGNLIVVAVTAELGATFGVTDSAGNVYTALTAVANEAHVSQVFYCLSSVAKSGNVVTASYSAPGQCAVIAQQYSGSSEWTLDATGGSSATYGYAFPSRTTPAFATAGAGVLAEFVAVSESVERTATIDGAAPDTLSSARFMLASAHRATDTHLTDATVAFEVDSGGFICNIHAVSFLSGAADNPGGGGDPGGGGEEPGDPIEGSAIETTFDADYDSGFALDASTTTRSYTLIPAPAKTASLATPGYTDTAHGVNVYRMTAQDDITTSPVFLRHEYSRRNPFNADSSRYIAIADGGHWYLYNAATFAMIPQTGTADSIPNMAGDCEPIWHPTDPNKLWYTDRNGGTAFYEYDITTGSSSTLFDLTGKWPAAFSAAEKVASFQGEGRPSNDGRYFALQVQAKYPADEFFGIIMFDSVLDDVIGWFVSPDGNDPNWTTTSPLGNYFIGGWYSSIGVVAFPRDYQGSSIAAGKKLTAGYVEHGDTALGPNGEEYYVQVDYAGGSSTEGQIRVANCATGTAFGIPGIPYAVGAAGTATSAHVSGILSESHPGWCIVETASSSASNGSVRPDPTVRSTLDRVHAVELKPGGRMLHICEHYSSGSPYFNEPQATSNKDGTRIVFASSFNGRAGADDGAAFSYMATLPSWAIQ